ncbi:MAG: Rieske (2Fe-2S) protein [Rothia sp. (in: high G+C Gram-positive bacteria)]|nr:Rieske (2Fe-2S) protein [Rothia sp. (in: high G+C Gram-positive bacteria)]
MCTNCGCQKEKKDAPTPAEQAGAGERGLTRRQAVAGTAGLGAGAALLTACGGSGESESLTASDGRPPKPTDMAAVEDVPVGGVIQANNDGVTVMITQPTAGTFHAFSSVCTHQGCQLNAQQEKTMVCPCHTSLFSLEDGSVQGGPAETALPEFTVDIKDGRIWVS